MTSASANLPSSHRLVSGRCGIPSTDGEEKNVGVFGESTRLDEGRNASSPTSPLAATRAIVTVNGISIH